MYPTAAIVIKIVVTFHFVCRCGADFLWNNQISFFQFSDLCLLFSEPGYLGCYGDKTHARALPDLVYISRNMTVMMCINHCRARGYPYAGLEYGEECYCGAAGSSYSLYGRYWDSACQHPCTGYSNERCGGIGRIAVYISEWYTIQYYQLLFQRTPTR